MRRTRPHPARAAALHSAARDTLPAMQRAFAAALVGCLTLAALTADAAQPNSPPAATSGCLATGNGFLRAKIRGAMNLDIDWHNSEIECDGSERPNGTGLRLSFAGPRHSD